jgi:hypothetical protein
MIGISEMPNWTKSSVIIKGDPDVLKRISEYDFEFQSLYPCPYTDGEKSSEGWYKWCYIHWGTKLGPRDVKITSDVDASGSSLKIVFMTELATPHGFLAYLTLVNPSLIIDNTWAVEDNESVGRTLYKDGILVSVSFDPTEYTFDAVKVFASNNSWFDYNSYEKYYTTMVEGPGDKEWLKNLLPEVKVRVLKDTLSEFNAKMEALYLEV